MDFHLPDMHAYQWGGKKEDVVLSVTTVVKIFCSSDSQKKPLTSLSYVEALKTVIIKA